MPAGGTRRYRRRVPPFRAYRPGRRDVLDVLAAGLCMIAMLVELGRLPAEEVSVPTPVAAAAIVLLALPVTIRHRFPVASFGAALTVLFALVSVAAVHDTVGFPSVLCGYTLAQLRGRPAAIVGGLVALPVVLSILQIFSPHPLLGMDTLRNMALVVVPLALGVAAHDRRAATEALLQRAEAAERSREEEALRRVGEERLRIARDVHDVVAHAMVAINIQAGVGAHLIDRDPDQTRHTLREIKRVSGEALGDLRAMLGLLRNEDDDHSAPVTPTVGLADLDDLRPGLLAVGVDLEVAIDPAAADLPATVGVAGYRIAQEALTNVIRHAGATTARVRVEVRHGSVVIEVEDDGGEGGQLGHTGSGNGLRGMRERALAVGGTLEAGPRSAGGWRVAAVLPTTPPAVPASAALAPVGIPGTR